MVMFSDKVTVPGHVLVRFLDKEAVLLNIETERYFGLDETGARMWQLATTATNIDAAYQALLNEYDVDAETLREHLSELLEKLVDNGLLITTSSDVGTASAIQGVGAGRTRAFRACCGAVAIYFSQPTASRLSRNAIKLAKAAA